MINRKTKQIREANLILEKRYLNEQVTSTPPSATTTPSSTSTSPVVTTTTTVKKMSKTKLKSLRDCSGFNSGKFGLTSGSTEDNYVIFNLNGKPFCKKQETK